MRSFGFLLSKRWVVFALVVVVLAYAAWWLGEWQFGRLTDRKAENTVIRTNEGRAPAPVADVLVPGRPPRDSDEWRVVTATGTYDAGQTVVVRYRTRDGVAGVDVVVPLVTSDGTTLLVDRGWLATDPGGRERSGIPAPPSGEVEVSGYVRADGEGDSTRVEDLSTRAVSSREIARAIGRPTYGGFVELRSEDPTPATSLAPVELPELDNGPHFFYGLQWWFFGALAVFGFCYLLYDEWRNGPPGDRPARPRNAPRPRSKARLQADAARRQIEREKAEAVRSREQRTHSAPPTDSMTSEPDVAPGGSRKAAAGPSSPGPP